MIRVATIEDDSLLRQALELEINRSPDLHCAGAFSSWPDAQLAIEFNRIDPDVVLLDLQLPGGGDGIDIAREIKTRWPRIKVLMFTLHESAEKILNAFSAGADGYLLKTTPREQLAEAVRSVHVGGSPMSPRVAETLVAHFRRRQPLLLALSPVEKRILEQLDQGRSYKQIADKEGMTINTLKTHAKRILVKSFAASMSEAAYLRKQLV